MTRRKIWWAIPLVASAVCLVSLSTLARISEPMQAQSQTTVTAAGSGVFSTGTAFNGVALSTLTFGMGVQLPGDGTANGGFESTLTGTSATGIARSIVVVGEPTNGLRQAADGATYVGTCRVDLGDGTPALTGVPFTVTVALLPNGNWGLSLTLGATPLPTATVATGSVTVK
jgi:hypothetical protein